MGWSTMLVDSVPKMYAQAIQANAIRITATAMAGLSLLSTVSIIWNSYRAIVKESEVRFYAAIISQANCRINRIHSRIVFKLKICHETSEAITRSRIGI